MGCLMEELGVPMHRIPAVGRRLSRSHLRQSCGPPRRVGSAGGPKVGRRGHCVERGPKRGASVGRGVVRPTGGREQAPKFV